MTQQIAGVDRSVLGKEAYDLSANRSEISQLWTSSFQAYNAEVSVPVHVLVKN